jgi:putative salt-induced outer membrane protein
MAWAEEKRLSNEGELSFVQTGGNTDVTTFAAKNKLGYDFSGPFSVLWKAALLYGKDAGEKNAERYGTDGRVEYTISDKTYFYGQAGWLQDKFAGLDNRYFGGPGAGIQIFAGQKHSLSTELGANYAMEEYTDNTDNEFMEGRGFAKYQYRFNEKVTFTQQLEYLQNFKEQDKYKTFSISDLTTDINDHFSLKIAYEVRYDNQPTPETLDNVDSLLSVALVVGI